MNILVTGGAGFIGYHLISTLVNIKDINIISIDNINNYYDINLKIDRLNKLGINFNLEKNIYKSNTYTNLHFIKLDITNKNEVENLFKNNAFDVVMHLAAQAGVRYSIENPRAYIESNIDGFFNIIENSRLNDVKNFLYASSSSVYGNNDKSPFNEADRVDFPLSLYAATKRSNELMASVYSSIYGISTIGLRFFTVYGPWGRPDMAPYLFSSSIVENKEISVYNNGNMKRDFTYVDDVAELLAKLILAPNLENSNNQSLIYNIGNGQSTSILEFINNLEISFKKSSKKLYKHLQLGDAINTNADNSLILELFPDFKFTPLEVGVKEYVKWFNEYYV
jgi:UDP-glucuronate 4-epimerase